MSAYKDFVSQEMSDIGVSGGSSTTQQAFQNVTQSGVVTVTHDADTTSSRIVQIIEFEAGDTGLVNTSLDFDLGDEGDFIQEDSVSGTDFIDGKVTLYSGTNGYTTTKPYYVTTSDSNQINLSNIAEINSIAVTKTEPADTLIKSLVSFDDRNTWKAYHGETRMVVDIGDEGTYDVVDVYFPVIIKESDISYKMWYSGGDVSNYRILYATSIDGVVWTNNQMVVNIGSEGTYDTLYITAHSVIKENDTSYKMWYSGSNGSYRIIYCTSTDGITWSNHQMVVNIGAEGTYDTVHVNTPTVIKESSTSYKMWYSGDDGSNNRLIYCTSTDGITWSNHQMVVNIGAEGTYDTIRAGHPSVIKESASSYKMWYGGYNGSNWRIIYCTSTNGTTWTNHQMVINIGAEGTYDITHVYSPIIIKESNTLYKMWYAGNNSSAWRIIYAESNNGTTWNSSFSETVNFSDITASGGFIAPMEDILTNYTVVSGSTYLDFAFDLSTVNSGTTPELDLITINYDEIGTYDLAKMNTDYSVSYHSSTQTKVTKYSVGTENIKVNVII